MMRVSVRLANSSVDQHITRLLSSVSWRSVAPGGFATASISLQSPISVEDPRLKPFTRVYIYNCDGSVLWEGRLQIPGRTAGDQGEVWDLTAIGPSGHASDQTAVLIYIDTDLTKWVRAPGNAPGADVGINSDPLGSTLDGLRVQFPAGQPITTNSKAQAGYELFTQSGMEIGAYGFSWNAGITDVNYTIQTVTGPLGVPFFEAPSSQAAGGTGVTSVSRWVIDNFPAARVWLYFRMIRGAGGATTIANDNTWAQTWNFRVLGRRMLKDGTLVSGSAGMESTTRVRAHQVVADLLGRLLPQYDGANAAVNTSSAVDIDQLVYPDGVTPAQVLEDLMKLEPAYYWAAWESNGQGQYRFEWSPWPTSVRYEASVVDGFTSPAPSFEQYNRVVVRWKDYRGQIKTTTRTQDIPDLTAEGIIREHKMDLGDEVGSLANAQKAGDEFLAEHFYPPSGGTLTVARKIVDLADGASVNPWQIKPGELIRVRGVEASRDALAAEHRDGQTVFRIVSVDAGGDGTAQLELDMYTHDEIRAIAELQKRRTRRR